jgi:hypothetical protein
MKPSKLYEALHALIGERVPIHIWGACGDGKSQIVAQVADDLDFDFIYVRAVQLDPVDLRGLQALLELDFIDLNKKPAITSSAASNSVFA